MVNVDAITNDLPKACGTIISNASFIAEGGGPPEVASQHYMCKKTPQAVSQLACATQV